MPHCIVEHSASLNGEDLLPLVFQGALNSNLFAADGRDIKVRAQAYRVYQTGNTSSDFIHVVLKILSGREEADKQKLSLLVLEELCGLNLTACSITVEVIDMDRDSYVKLVT
ncbi:5-carboxymethyl-2-hydroxymuconate isomerase [Amphritea sp. 1_MG-2023]|uniref:5-carboxymethyl-2-hydroxymuconate Delta-isomerase n=1 Tax=Amphritea sp. 1_MG-2023 TaxID=3062670 RepID=UPI0026E19A5A|nr:5-carboxymethyl-2-hydroxymuconate isomerase [Amphritea sp. 1_MG-2023]MDO6563372.1 5-carboxymethyl-2-hydroxymuconate isomerase [Amphritea sp. 1_MG-2023]